MAARLPPRFGAHVSTAGGLEHALERGRSAGCDVVQVFTKSNQQWAARPIEEEELARWRAARRRTGVEPVMAHAAYLINLAAPTAAAQRRAVAALRLESERCRVLGIPYLVIHPGAHRGAGARCGILRAAALIDRWGEASGPGGPRLLLENTAGQGSSLGVTFAELRDLLGAVRGRWPLGICLDSCHLFAAGYELRTTDGVERTLDELERTVGLAHLRAWHVNDSRGAFGSRRDRHAHIGHGELGLRAFRALVNAPRLARLPMVVETPKPVPEADAVNVALLRALWGARRVPPRASRLLNRWRRAMESGPRR